MSRAVKAQGIECPIIREGDNIVDIVVDSVLNEVEDTYYQDWNHIGKPEKIHTGQYSLENKSVIGITESIIARADGQYITVDDIATDIEKKFGKDATICLVNPIYSRNRFAMILKGIARAAKKVIIVIPDYDEVGNPRGVNPFTGVNIEEYYKKICESENCECEIIDKITRDNEYRFTKSIYCGLHDYEEWKGKICEFGGISTEDGCILHSDMYSTLADICSDKSPDWGVLGTNKATEERLKLFPSKAECQRVCEAVKIKIKEKTEKDVIVCVYGDGCFKDPVGGIWEFADPTTMPGYTDKGLIESTPNELKLKYFIDSNSNLSEISLSSAYGAVSEDTAESKDSDVKQGTTPRLYRDLLASLMDLTSGSGDRATPVVLIQNYF